MDDLQPRRLTKKSQALALDEFQLIDLNFHTIKSKEEIEHISSQKVCQIEFSDVIHIVGNSITRLYFLEVCETLEK